MTRTPSWAVHKSSLCIKLELDDIKVETYERKAKKGQHDCAESKSQVGCLRTISDIDLMVLVLQIDPLACL